MISEIQNLLPILAQGFGTTLAIFGLTLFFSIPLGLLVAVLKMSKYKVIRYPVTFYVSVMRGTPLLLQIVAIYFGTYYLSRSMNADLSFDRFPAVIFAFSVNYAAYFAEIFRGGIEAIPKGQYEAGQVLGMTKAQVFFKVVLFQVFKRVVPPLGNEIITLVKDTSLARIIAVKEIIMVAQNFISSKALIWPLFYSGLFYLVFCGLLTILFGFIEKKLDYYRG